MNVVRVGGPTCGGPSGSLIRLILTQVDPRNSFFQEADSVSKLGVLNVKGFELLFHVSEQLVKSGCGKCSYS